MSERKFEAVLFDVDGTLLDTREYTLQAYKHSIKHHLKQDVAWEKVAPTLGLPIKECYRILTGLDDVKDLMVTHDEFQYRNFQLISAYKNTLVTLESLHKAGVKMGAVTSRFGKQVLQSLKITGIDQYIKVIVTPLEVKNAKPHPESIFLAMDTLKVSVKSTVFVGDSPFDIQAGKAAGCSTIGVLYGYHGQRLVKSKPDYLVSDISEILPIILGN